MKKRVSFKNFRISIFIIGLLIISWGFIFKTPVYAIGPWLRINVTPSNISFNIVDAEDPEEYYSGNQEVIVESRHTLNFIDWIYLKLPWHLGIRAADAYLKDSINPENQIPISQLRWSRDGRNFQQFSQEWVLVNSYIDSDNKPYEETITYRLYPETGQSLPAGLYSVRIEFDVRWQFFPWK
jgi:hypothetical protein